jgi:hypothetical protein
MRIRLKESQLKRLSEDNMGLYFNMVIAELKTYIGKLNNLYDGFNDYTVMSMINIDYTDIRGLHNSFDAGVDKISSMMSKYDDKMDSLDWDAYREERSSIVKMTNSIKSKENMLSDIFYKLRELSDIKDDYKNNPFNDIKTMNIG